MHEPLGRRCEQPPERSTSKAASGRSRDGHSAVSAQTSDGGSVARVPEATVGPIGGDTAADDDIRARGPTVAPSPQPLGDVEGPLTARSCEQLDAWWRAANYLAVGPDLPDGQPAAARAAAARARQAAAARALRHRARAEPGLRARQPADPRSATSTRSSSPAPATAARARTPAPGSRAPTPSCTATSRRTREGMRALLPAVLLPRRRAQPLRAGDPRLVPRGRRARATRCCTRTARRSTTRTWSSFCVVGDGEAETGPLADELALRQVPQPGPRRRGAADPAPQRVQDRQPDAAGPDPRGRAARAAARLRLRPARRRRRRPGRGAPGDGRRAGRRASTGSREIQTAARGGDADRPPGAGR